MAENLYQRIYDQAYAQHAKLFPDLRFRPDTIWAGCCWWLADQLAYLSVWVRNRDEHRREE